MKEILTQTGYMLLASLLALLEVLFWIVAGPVVLLLKLYSKIRYEAQCLQYPLHRGERVAAMRRFLEKR